jgi:hypothetical protein
MAFGYVTCVEHGDNQKAWFICRHIKRLTDIVWRQEWNEKDGGSLCCSIHPEEHGADDLTLICEAHLKEMGLFEMVH